MFTHVHARANTQVTLIADSKKTEQKYRQMVRSLPLPSLSICQCFNSHKQVKDKTMALNSRTKELEKAKVRQHPGPAWHLACYSARMNTHISIWLLDVEPGHVST